MASTFGKYLRVEINPEGYAVVLLQKEPVNTLDTQLWKELLDCLETLETNAAVNGLIIGSGVKREVFSAGNDLNEIYAPVTTYSRYANFWELQNRFLVNLYRSRLATLAAIRGACPAGGCIISLCCDFRFMTGTGTIGLNEVLLGVPVPKFWAELMGRVIGTAAAERLTLNGRLVTPVEALDIKLIDQIANSSEELLPMAEEHMKKLVKLPPEARYASKLAARTEFCNAWQSYSLTESAGAWQLLNHPEALSNLSAAISKLSKGPSKL